MEARETREAIGQFMKRLEGQEKFEVQGKGANGVGLAPHSLQVAAESFYRMPDYICNVAWASWLTACHFRKFNESWFVGLEERD